ncbi:hypothetical protein THRCLA_01037 [Thraustotheca clavata]|uniref:Uncharacterized protein n=1 Tax=Thraustotheca clavata TaxID=74557 RepID=A0A1W0A9T7_9STRA|nr:hypothetical protein THRCLA_01037 [Thraustotheca clavata]
MANLARRQQRCNDMASNAAIILEDNLSNIAWNTFTLCWDDAFDIAFGIELRRSTTGIIFLQNLTTIKSVSREVSYWKQFNLTSYTFKWQNYKYIGHIRFPMIMESAIRLRYRQPKESIVGVSKVH